MDGWKYLEREVVTDPKGKRWSVALMDVLGQEGDAEEPSAQLALQYVSGRYFTVIYSETGTLQWERGHLSLGEARQAYARLLSVVTSGRLDPDQPVFREDLED
jgi:hypothetical protein